MKKPLFSATKKTCKSTTQKLKPFSIGFSAIMAISAGMLAPSPALASETTLDTQNTVANDTKTAGLTADAPAQFIVKFKDSPGKSASLRQKAYGNAAKKLGVSVKEVKNSPTGTSVVKVKELLTDGEAKAFSKSLKENPDIEYVERDVLLQVTSTPNDTYFSEQWNLQNTVSGINVTPVWDTNVGKNTVVAVVDTGIVYHSDLSPNILPGYDMINDAGKARDGNGRDSNPKDEGDYRISGDCNSTATTNSSWHGTAVAGVVAAVQNNNKGVSGVSPGAKIVPVRALGLCGGWVSDIADSILWSSGAPVSGTTPNANPADVINLSIGGETACSITLQNAINTANDRGSVVVSAAGNGNKDASHSMPANCQNVISVAALDKDGNRASYSNYGRTVDIAAPAGDSHEGALTTYNAGKTTSTTEAYSYYNGTSTAAPHVAGVAALIKSWYPSMSPADVEQLLKNTASPIAGDCSLGCGSGKLDASNALPLAFKDIKGNPFAKEITWMSDQGISKGWSDGTYRPLEPVKRDAMAAFVYRMAGSPNYTAPSTSAFKDISTSNPFYKEISWMEHTDLSNGWSDGTYRPLNDVSREAMAAFMYRYASEYCNIPAAINYKEPSSPTFSDTSYTPFKKEIEWMRSSGISTGWSDNTYKPLETTNRDAMAAFMYRLDGYVNQNGGCNP